MIKYAAIFILLVANGLQLYSVSNEQDSIISPKDISFINKFEQEVLCKYFKTGTSEYFELFLATSKDIDSDKAEKNADIYNNFLKNLCTDKFMNYNPRRQIRILYRTVNNTFFNKYEFIDGVKQSFLMYVLHSC